ncbi:MAG TPA: AI-2E family transporter [Chloroflexota bacterium]|nr:AI-2E family transporter [Chloroflexota bacterium]
MRLSAAASPAGQVLLYGACAVLVAAGMQAAATLVSALVLAVVLATVLAPLLRRLREAGVPGWLAGIIVLVPVVLIGVLFVGFLVQSLGELNAKIPGYITRLSALAAVVSERFFGDPAALRGMMPAMTPEPGQIVALATGALGGALQATNDMLLVLFILLYTCMEAESFPTRVQAVVGPTSGLPRRLASLAEALRAFVLINGQAGLLVAIVRTGLLLVLGVDFALLWGAWSLLLTYVPTVGYPLAVLPPTLLALVDRGPVTALIVFVAFGVVNTVVYNLLQPHWAGASLNLSPLVVIVSLFLWGIILGAMGALLAVPLTMMAITLLESSEQTRWLAALMRDHPPTAAETAALPTGGPAPTSRRGTL